MACNQPRNSGSPGLNSGIGSCTALSARRSRYLHLHSQLLRSRYRTANQSSVRYYFRRKEMDVCAGGTIGAGATSIEFINHHTEDCTITYCNMPGWPTTNQIVPKKVGSVPGKLTVQLSTPA